MLSSILNSKTAIQVNIEIIRAFVLLRQLSISNKEIFDKISELENRYNQHFDDIFEAINYLLKKDTQVKKQEERKRIGF